MFYKILCLFNIHFWMYQYIKVVPFKESYSRTYKHCGRTDYMNIGAPRWIKHAKEDIEGVQIHHAIQQGTQETLDDRSFNQRVPAMGAERHGSMDTEAREVIARLECDID